MTYSIVARDKGTGELGVAVQSHYFQVGPVVPWAVAGVGAVATQSMVNVSFGPLGLEYMRSAYSAEQALKALLAGDSQPESRQVALVDATGSVAVHTGAKCIPAAGHRTGDGFSCQANLMEKDTVWDAMFEAYTTTEAPLAERMEEQKDIAGATAKMREAITLAPEMVEIQFWSGLSLAQAGQLDEGCELMAVAVAKDKRWIETLHRLVAVDRLSADLASQVEARLTSTSRRP